MGMTKPPGKTPAKVGAKKVSPALRRIPVEAGALASAARRGPSTLLPDEGRFAEVLALIEAARNRAYQAINTELVSLYWQLGEHISQKIEKAEWGDGVVDELAATLARRYPGLRGFTRRNLFRMRQFFDAYRGHQESVTAGDTIAVDPPSHHSESDAAPRGAGVLHPGRHQGAVDQSVSSSARSSRPRSCASVPSAKLVSPAVAQGHTRQRSRNLKNAYNLEFLSLQSDHSEADLHGALLRNLGRFIAELGRDFCFVGSEYPVQVGNQDFAIDLVFFHRGAAVPGGHSS
jgi:predicted nuclease of restriction endonuclease-like (RecB) superfamily